MGSGSPEIAEAAFQYQQALEKGDKHVVGVTDHTDTITARPICQSPVSSNTISVVEIGAPRTAAATAPIPAKA